MGKRSKSGVADDTIIEVIAASGELGDGVLTPDAVPATVASLIEGVADSVVSAARATGAAKFGVEFGIRTRKDGSATLADEPARGTFRVFLEWPGGDR